MPTARKPLRESTRLALELMPRDRAERRSFRKALLSELPPVKRAALTPFWSIIIELLLKFLPGLLDLFARFREDDPDAASAALSRIVAEPVHPVSAALMSEDD